jgi:hypothetical protein
MSEETMSLGKLLEVYGVEEEQGYEAPFLTLTWARWLELQRKMLEAFCRFQRAVDKQQPQLATIITLEMQEIVSELQREACAWVGEAQIKTKPRQPSHHQFPSSPSGSELGA